MCICIWLKQCPDPGVAEVKGREDDADPAKGASMQQVKGPSCR